MVSLKNHPEEEEEKMKQDKTMDLDDFDRSFETSSEKTEDNS